MSRRAFIVAAAALSLVLTGCTAASDPASTAKTTATSPASAVVARTTTSYGAKGAIDIAVHPLVRTGKTLVLTLDVSSGLPDSAFSSGLPAALHEMWSTDYVGARAWDGVRLIDLGKDLVIPTATDASGRTVATTSGRHAKKQFIQIAYADPGEKSLAVYLPMAGLVQKVPVIDGAVPAGGAAKDPLKVSDVARADAFPMRSYAADLAAKTRTTQDDARATFALSSDVLFATGSAELGASAQAAIAAAAAQIALRKAGTVQIVGHTDSVDTTESNQVLSEQRAAAVAAALRPLVSESDYPFSVSGKGETEPIADNSTADGRQLNRRVALTIDTAPRAAPQPAQDSLPAFDGAVATGEKGVDVSQAGIPVHVSASEAKVVDGHLVVTLALTRRDDAVSSVVSPGAMEAGFALPAEFSTVKTTGGVAVMTGALATLPAFAQTAKDKIGLPLADVRTNARLDGGQTRRVDLVYPRTLAVGSTVTLQLDSAVRGSAWRLADIPVTH